MEKYSNCSKIANNDSPYSFSKILLNISKITSPFTLSEESINPNGLNQSYTSSLGLGVESQAEETSFNRPVNEWIAINISHHKDLVQELNLEERKKRLQKILSQCEDSLNHHFEVKSQLTDNFCTQMDNFIKNKQYFMICSYRFNKLIEENDIAIKKFLDSAKNVNSAYTRELCLFYDYINSKKPEYLGFSLDLLDHDKDKAAESDKTLKDAEMLENLQKYKRRIGSAINKITKKYNKARKHKKEIATIVSDKIAKKLDSNITFLTDSLKNLSKLKDSLDQINQKKESNENVRELIISTLKSEYSDLLDLKLKVEASIENFVYKIKDLNRYIDLARDGKIEKQLKRTTSHLYGYYDCKNLKILDKSDVLRDFNKLNILYCYLHKAKTEYCLSSENDEIQPDSLYYLIRILPFVIKLANTPAKVNKNHTRKVKDQIAEIKGKYKSFGLNINYGVVMSYLFMEGLMNSHSYLTQSNSTQSALAKFIKIINGINKDKIWSHSAWVRKNISSIEAEMNKFKVLLEIINSILQSMQDVFVLINRKFECINPRYERLSESFTHHLGFISRAEQILADYHTKFKDYIFLLMVMSQDKSRDLYKDYRILMAVLKEHKEAIEQRETDLMREFRF